LRADISLLFNLFVTSQRIRRVLGDAMALSGMKPDEYAVYSLLFEKAPLTATEMADLLGMPLTTVLDYLKAMSAAGHLKRLAHPTDGRAVQLRLNVSGIAAHRRAHDSFVAVNDKLIARLPIGVDRVKLGLAALDDAAQLVSALPPTQERSTARSRTRPRRGLPTARRPATPGRSLAARAGRPAERRTGRAP
jgi:DNA-binding MarR family transcriptional regulator